MTTPASIGEDAQTLCRDLLCIDTTNPPGNERQAALYLAEALREYGYVPVVLDSAPGRSNVVCRRPGSGSARPLLLTAHLDVVEADPRHWRYPPFSGALAEGCLWGRGAIDMKNMAAMSVAVLRQLAQVDARLSRDVIFAGVADEEAGCDHGSRWLVENHRDLVEAEYAIGEGGGFSLHIGASTVYPIQVAEKCFCGIRARARGEPGHGSMPRPDSAIFSLASALHRLRSARLPVHPTAYLQQFVAAVAARQPPAAKPLLKLATGPRVLQRLMPRLSDLLSLAPNQSMARGLGALLSNTASPTVLRSGAKVNVIPGEAEALIDGRTLPGQTDADLLDELAAVLGPDIELEVVKSMPPTVTEPVESPLYDAIVRQVQRREPDAAVVPYMLPGFTDAKYFTKTGARWYGFAPVKLERDSGLRFADMFHGHNERIPIAGLHWGAELLYDIVVDIAQ
jgi:acetylornithine deacetylase/succinyl-diaminopimelate desuccinylase-like protein